MHSNAESELVATTQVSTANSLDQGIAGSITTPTLT